MFRRVRGFGADVVTYSLVQGRAFGGGFECALASEIIVAERGATMSFPEVLFNMFPGMGALSLLVTRAVTWPLIALVGLLVGVAGAVTMKVIFYLPPLLGATWLRLQQERADRRREVALRISASAVLSVLVFGILMLWHRTGVDLGISRGGAAASALETVFAAGLVPQARYLSQQILLAPHAAALILVAPLFWKRFTDEQRIALASFLLPLVTVAFYRNSYPYYFVFVLAPAMTTVGPALQRMLGVIGYWPYSAVLALSALLLNIAEPRQILANQRSLVSGVHEIFPRPAAYLDFSGVIGDYPRPLSILVSGWGLQRYRNGEEPTLVELTEKLPTPLLIVNHLSFAVAVKGDVSPYGLLPADVEMLRTNYVPYWGMVWVAGKQLPKGSKPVRTDFAVPGPYLVQGGAIAIDGRSVAPGETVMIGRGPHILTPDASVDAGLRWGEHLQMPARTPPDPNASFTDY